MQNTATDKIWIFISALILTLTIAGAVRSLAETPEELYELGQEALSREAFEKAAELYRNVYLEHQESTLAADAHYWEAFSLYRMGTIQYLRQAARVLEQQLENYPDADTHNDSRELAVRLYSELAERGDASAARRIREISGEEQADQTKLAALQALMNMDEKRAMPILSKLITDPKANKDLRRHAIFIIGQMDGDEAETILVNVLENEDDPELQSEIIMWLAMHGSERSLDAIMKVYRENKNGDIAQAALMAMGHHGGAKAMDILEEIALDEDASTDIRCQSLHALAQSDSPGTAELLVQVMKSTGDSDLKQMALFALSHVEGTIPDEVFMDLIRDPSANDEMRAQALHFAADRGQVETEFIMEIYNSSSDSNLKSQCCWVLSDMGGDEALDTLIGIVRKENDPEVRQQAVFWIGQFETDTAADFLLELINEE